MAEVGEPRVGSSTERVLEGRRAVVTGASSGIGRAIALQFAAAGADVVVHYAHSSDAAEAVAAEASAHGVASRTVRADLASTENIDRLIADIFDDGPGADIWVNNAGQDILTGAGARLTPHEQLDRLIAVDLRGTVLCCWPVAERMRGRGGGVILNMSWDRALTGMAGRQAEMFSAVKGGVQAFSRSLALSVAPHVRVNVLAPGWIATAFADALDDDARRRIAGRTPLRRWGEPEDVARAALFLASPAAEFLTGVVLPINGGAA